MDPQHQFACQIKNPFLRPMINSLNYGGLLGRCHHALSSYVYNKGRLCRVKDCRAYPADVFLARLRPYLDCHCPPILLYITLFPRRVVMVVSKIMPFVSKSVIKRAGIRLSGQGTYSLRKTIRLVSIRCCTRSWTRPVKSPFSAILWCVLCFNRSLLRHMTNGNDRLGSPCKQATLTALGR